jgi:hypothetical protein
VQNPGATATVEVASALEGLLDTYAVGIEDPGRAEKYVESITVGIEHLLGVQVRGEGRGCGIR